MIIDMTPTVENMEQAKKTTLELMANPWCDQFMFLSLQARLDKIEAKLKELRNEQD